MKKPELQDYGITPEEYGRYGQMSGTSPDFTDGRFPAFLIFFTPMLVGIGTLLITREPGIAIALAVMSSPIPFILLVLFVLCRMIYRFIKRSSRSRISPNPIVTKIEQYEEAKEAFSEVQLAAEGRRVEAEQEAQKKRIRG